VAGIADIHQCNSMLRWNDAEGGLWREELLKVMIRRARVRRVVVWDPLVAQEAADTRRVILY
jgi:hypothetical protein